MRLISTEYKRILLCEKSLNVTLKQLPGEAQLAANPEGKNADTGTVTGVAVQNLNQEARQEFNIPKTVEGAVITAVRPDSAAAAAGLKAGDVIEGINRHPVKSADDAVKLTETAKDNHTLDESGATEPAIMSW